MLVLGQSHALVALPKHGPGANASAHQIHNSVRESLLLLGGETETKKKKEEKHRSTGSEMDSVRTLNVLRPAPQFS